MRSRPLLRSFSSRPMRWLRIYALFCVLASTLAFSTGELLVGNALAASGSCKSEVDPTVGGNCTTDADCASLAPDAVCVPTPELPTVMVPLFLAVAAGSFMVIRRRQLQAVRA